MRWTAVVVLAACGRLDFDARAPDATGSGNVPDASRDGALGHDEDGDGVPDAIDVCPHVADPAQLDTDGDGIGDVCDPEPTNPRQHLALFATLQPTDNPLVVGMNSDPWTQDTDSIDFDGSGYGNLTYALAETNVRIAIGVDILGLSNGSGVQHQVALGYQPDAPPIFFGELTQQPTFEGADLTEYDGTSYTEAATKALANGVHAGSATMQVTMIGSADGSGGSASGAVDTGWVGDFYDLAAATPAYAGGTHVTIVINNVTCHIRYAWIVTW